MECYGNIPKLSIKQANKNNNVNNHVSRTFTYKWNIFIVGTGNVTENVLKKTTGRK